MSNHYRPVTARDRDILDAVEQYEGERFPVTDTGADLGISKQRVSELLGILCERGLVEKTARGTYRLTPEGVERIRRGR